MQNLVTQIQALSQPADWGHLVTTLDSDGVLSAAGGVGAVGGILAQLNAQDHTVGYAVLLHFKISADEAAGNSTGDLETLRQVCLSSTLALPLLHNTKRGNLLGYVGEKEA
jgi:hypothetical protein